MIIIKQASWHQAYLEKQLTNLSIIHLPPYLLELNSRSWLRQNEIANRSFKDLTTSLINAVCIAWNRFCEDKKRVISLCYRVDKIIVGNGIIHVN